MPLSARIIAGIVAFFIYMTGMGLANKFMLMMSGMPGVTVVVGIILLLLPIVCYIAACENLVNLFNE